VAAAASTVPQTPIPYCAFGMTPKNINKTKYMGLDKIANNLKDQELLGCGCCIVTEEVPPDYYIVGSPLR
jgi:hypothetical protein